jgi:hypothetical protein
VRQGDPDTEDVEDGSAGVVGVLGDRLVLYHPDVVEDRGARGGVAGPGSVVE